MFRDKILSIGIYSFIKIYQFFNYFCHKCYCLTQNVYCFSANSALRVFTSYRVKLLDSQIAFWTPGIYAVMSGTVLLAGLKNSDKRIHCSSFAEFSSTLSGPHTIVINCHSSLFKYLNFKYNLPTVSQTAITAELIASLINVFIPMRAVLFMSATSIAGSSEEESLGRTRLRIKLSYTWSLNADTCSLSTSGTCQAGSKQRPFDNYVLRWHDNLPSDVSQKINLVMSRCVLPDMIFMYHLGTLQLICIKLESLIKGSDEKWIFLKVSVVEAGQNWQRINFFPPVVVDDSHLESKMVSRLYQYNQQILEKSWFAKFSGEPFFFFLNISNY